MFVENINFRNKTREFKKELLKFRQKNYRRMLKLNGNFFDAHFTYILLRSQPSKVQKCLNRD